MCVSECLRWRQTSSHCFSSHRGNPHMLLFHFYQLTNTLVDTILQTHCGIISSWNWVKVVDVLQHQVFNTTLSKVVDSSIHWQNFITEILAKAHKYFVSPFLITKDNEKLAFLSFAGFIVALIRVENAGCPVRRCTSKNIYTGGGEEIPSCPNESWTPGNTLTSTTVQTTHQK